MECHCIPTADVPHLTRLYSTYIQDFPSLSRFYAHAPTVEEVRRRAAEASIDPSLRNAVTDVLRAQNREFGADSSVESSLDRLAAGSAAIVTGQQVGLFSGPSYTIYKALTALRLANDLTAAGTPAVAIFWLASEDHDLAEVNHSFWPTRGEPERFEIPLEGAANRRVGNVRLGDSVRDLVERAAAMLGGPARSEVAKALKDSYQPAETYGSAFGKLMARIFTGTGLILLDPLSPELHRLAGPVYRSALEQHAELGRELLARSKALELAGYHAQVKVTERNTLLFVDVEGERVALRAREGDFVVGRRALSLAETLGLLGEAPEMFSANALLRPVVQDTLLPTAAYVAGPAEIAYFAQASVVYKQLSRPMPVILPRASFTLVDPHVERSLRKYGLELSDIFRGKNQLRSKMERVLLPRPLARRLEASGKSLRELLQGLREPIEKLDPTLLGALDTAEHKILYQFANLEGKAARAISLRSASLDAHERELMGLLYPRGDLQERSLCFLPMLAAQGPGLLEELSRRITPGGTLHQVLYF
jgi:bacillithiol biosynthesis cysteine-adding enzyme BshC